MVLNTECSIVAKPKIILLPRLKAHNELITINPNQVCHSRETSRTSMMRLEKHVMLEPIPPSSGKDGVTLDKLKVHCTYFDYFFFHL